MENNIFEKYKIFSFKDSRGDFLKVYDSNKLLSLDNVKEVFVTTSKKNTLRGMHYQKKPFEVNKIVVCLKGRVLDVVVNINKNNKDFGKVMHTTINQGEGVLVPKDYAHGFYSEEDSQILYITDQLYSNEYEDGYFWKSIPFNWPSDNPLISERDAQLPFLNKNI